MQVISLKIDELTASKLEQVARDGSRSKSAVIREAIDLYLRNSSSLNSLKGLEGIEDLVGCVAGLADLSTNRVHMSEFGR